MPEQPRCKYIDPIDGSPCRFCSKHTTVYPHGEKQFCLFHHPGGIEFKTQKAGGKEQLLNAYRKINERVSSGKPTPYRGVDFPFDPTAVFQSFETDTLHLVGCKFQDNLTLDDLQIRNLIVESCTFSGSFLIKATKTPLESLVLSDLKAEDSLYITEEAKTAEAHFSDLESTHIYFALSIASKLKVSGCLVAEEAIIKVLDGITQEKDDGVALQLHDLILEGKLVFECPPTDRVDVVAWDISGKSAELVLYLGTRSSSRLNNVALNGGKLLVESRDPNAVSAFDKSLEPDVADIFLEKPTLFAFGITGKGHFRIGGNFGMVSLTGAELATIHVESFTSSTLSFSDIQLFKNKKNYLGQFGVMNIDVLLLKMENVKARLAYIRESYVHKLTLKSVDIEKFMTPKTPIVELEISNGSSFHELDLRADHSLNETQQGIDKIEVSDTRIHFLDLSNRVIRDIYRTDIEPFGTTPKYFNTQFRGQVEIPLSFDHFPLDESHSTSTYRHLKQQMETIRNRPAQGFFHVLEMRAMRLNKDSHWLDRGLSSLYDWGSVYGNSPGRALIVLLAIWIASFFSYWFIHADYSIGFGLSVDTGAALDSVIDVVRQTFVPFHLLRHGHDDVWLVILSSVQSLFSTAGLALLFFALRWKYQRT